MKEFFVNLWKEFKTNFWSILKWGLVLYFLTVFFLVGIKPLGYPANFIISVLTIFIIILLFKSGEKNED